MNSNLDVFVEELISSGEYKSKDEIIEDALELFRDARRLSKKKRNLIEKGLDEADYDLANGRFIELKTDEDMDAFLARI